MHTVSPFAAVSAIISRNAACLRMGLSHSDFGDRLHLVDYNALESLHRILKIPQENVFLD